MKTKPQLCVALDVTRAEEAANWIKRLGAYPVVFKFGLRLLPLLGAGFFRTLHPDKKKIFVDAKLHDIPSQVADAVSVWDSMGVDYLTIHLCGGEKMIAESLKAAQKTKILGVSVLTSLEQKDFQAEKDGRALDDIVKARVDLAYSQGLRWVVCSVHELSELLKKHPDLQCVTPGLYVDKAPADQSRTAPFEKALDLGSQMLVMGRSLLTAPKPEELVEKILKKIG